MIRADGGCRRGDLTASRELSLSLLFSTWTSLSSAVLPLYCESSLAPSRPIPVDVPDDDAAADGDVLALGDDDGKRYDVQAGKQASDLDDTD